eukprot:6193402-Pleurochrysis_carterae.AAC.3
MAATAAPIRVCARAARRRATRIPPGSPRSIPSPQAKRTPDGASEKERQQWLSSIERTQQIQEAEHQGAKGFLKMSAIAMVMFGLAKLYNDSSHDPLPTYSDSNSSPEEIREVARARVKAQILSKELTDTSDEQH